ncbi:RING finger protein 151-like isoform X2 [Orbicella faveolata]|uniref:RING finger protein 151-like isoform X2 n=1 Tax=Orbicella faveolata TaxID=48498 RepID=UPI0009E1DE47|nr:RING finger protein 151-like isoform X2 [Orbicella faveolata]
MSGYSPELFVENVDQEFLCSICYSVFNKPVSCQDGHSFCHHCITQWQSNNNHCPVDRRVLSDTSVRNLAVEGAISRRVIKCPSTISLPGGCSWTGPTAGLENHLHCDMKIMECNFKDARCSPIWLLCVQRKGDPAPSML